MKRILIVLFACLTLGAFGQGLEPVTTTNLRVIISKINELQGLVGTGGVTTNQVDSVIDIRLAGGIDLDTELAGYEPALGNPTENGYVLSSTTAGDRSWIAPPEGNGYDDTAINSRIDSLVAAVKVINEGIEDLWIAIGQLGELDLIAPKFVSAEVGATGDNKVIITMDEESIPDETAFAFSDGNGGISVTDVDIEDEYITLTLDEDAEYGETYTISYTQPETNPLQDIAENKTKSWENMEVTNNISAPPEPSKYDDIYDAMTTKPTGTYLAAQQKLVYRLDTASTGLYDRFHFLYVAATTSAADAMINWANPGTYNMTDPGNTEPSFTAWEGFTFTGAMGSSEYLSSNFTPISEMQNNFTLGAWTTEYYENNQIIGLSSTNWTNCSLYPSNGDNHFVGNIFSAPSSNFGTFSDETSEGLNIITRRASNEVEGYHNGVSAGIQTQASAFASQDWGPFGIGGNYRVVLDNYDAFFDGLFKIGFAIDAITSIEAEYLYEIFLDYLNEVSE